MVTVFIAGTPRHEQLAALLVPDGLDLDSSIVLIDVVEDAEIADAEFPFRQLIGAESLAVARLLGRLMRELAFDRGDDLLLIEFSQPPLLRLTGVDYPLQVRQ